MRFQFTILLILISVSCTSQWYGFGADLDALTDDQVGYFFVPIWQDSTVVNEYSDGVFPVWLYGLGQVLDPTTEVFEFSQDISLDEDQPYMVDSIAFPYNYLRYQTENPDTMIIQFFKEENLTLIEQPWPDWEGNEDQSRARLDYDSTLQRSPVPFLEITEILDDDDIADDELLWKSYHIGEFVNAGEVVAATVSYKSGNTYNFGDTLSYGYNGTPPLQNLRNQLVLRYYRDEQRLFYTDEYNHAYLTIRASRYEDNSNGWANQYWTGNATGDAFYHANIQFHLSPMVSVDENSAAEMFSFYPNPLDDVLTVDLKERNYKGYSVKIVDLLGKTVHSYPLADSNKMTIDLSMLPVGTYYVQLISEDRVYSKMIVKN